MHAARFDSSVLVTKLNNETKTKSSDLFLYCYSLHSLSCLQGKGVSLYCYSFHSLYCLQGKGVSLYCYSFYSLSCLQGKGVSLYCYSLHSLSCLQGKGVSLYWVQFSFSVLFAGKRCEPVLGTVFILCPVCREKV